MPEHERFEELCAVAAIGQLSEGELAELAEHLKSCYTCRGTAGEFAFLLHQLPIEETAGDERNTADVLSKSHRERFVARARGEGLKFSRMAEEGTPAGSSWWPRLRPVALIGVPALVVIAVAAFILPPLPAHQAKAPTNLTISTRSAPTSALRIESNEPANHSLNVPGLSSENEKLRAQLTRAQSEVYRVRMQADEANARAQEADQQLGEMRGELARAVAEAEKLRIARDAATAELVAQQYRLSSLNEEIKNERASVDQERQLTSVAKDVRELMGARNLHIIDVFDADGSGRPKKSFGRVFFVEGRSLIFYAFDLKQKSSGNTKVSFQAWGQRGASRDRPRSLGVFYVDDHAQGRWVLKVEDPAKLASIDSVFVTVEPLGGADQPTGQKLLYAFLGSYANHP